MNFEVIITLSHIYQL